MGPFANKAEAKAALEAEGFTWVDYPYGYPWRVDGKTLLIAYLHSAFGSIWGAIDRFPLRGAELKALREAERKAHRNRQ